MADTSPTTAARSSSLATTVAELSSDPVVRQDLTQIHHACEQALTRGSGVAAIGHTARPVAWRLADLDDAVAAHEPPAVERAVYAVVADLVAAGALPSKSAETRESAVRLLQGLAAAAERAISPPDFGGALSR